MNEQNISAQLRDIKPLLEIPDSSFTIYWGLIGFGSLLLAGILFFAVKRFWKNRKIDPAESYLEALNSIEWSSPKKAAYKATHYGRLLATDERRKELFSQLLPLLEQYKYKKETEKVNDATMQQFELYRKVCNGSV